MGTACSSNETVTSELSTLRHNNAKDIVSFVVVGDCNMNHRDSPLDDKVKAGQDVLEAAKTTLVAGEISTEYREVSDNDGRKAALPHAGEAQRSNIGDDMYIVPDIINKDFMPEIIVVKPEIFPEIIDSDNN